MNDVAGFRGQKRLMSLAEDGPSGFERAWASNLLI